MNEATQILRSSANALKTVNTRSTRNEPEEWDFPNWLTKHITIKKNGKIQKYSFEGFEPFLPIAKEMHKHDEQWFLKGTQVAFSTFMIGWNLYLPNWRGYDSGYGLPDKVMIKPFMKTRFSQEQIKQNKDLKRVYQMHETDMYYEAGPHYVYFLGANVLSDTLSRPMDQVSLDEVTIISKKSIEMIQERMDASSFAQFNGFAREIYPGGPCDVGFQSGTQHVMLFQCPACNEWQNLEELFYQSSLNHSEHPPCVRKIEGEWKVVCIKCQAPYRRSECGHWVAKFPEREIQSYRIPQVILEGRDLNKLMKRWLKSAKRKSKRAELHSSMLGIPDAGDLQRITRETLLALKRPYSVQNKAHWSIGGMDMGNSCWATFWDFEADVMRLIWAQEIDSDHVAELGERLIIDMNCMQFVIDALPLTTEARRLAYRFPQNVVLNYYKGTDLKEAEHEHLGNPFKVITQDREQALDSYCDLFTVDPIHVIFPARMIENDGREVEFEDSTFAQHHLRGSQKDEVDDPKLGKKVFKFKKNIPNHFFHAGNYAATAAALMAREEGKFSGIVPVFGEFGRN